MIIGIVGLGLIGGSLCKAIKSKTKHTVYGFDIDQSINSYAVLDKSIDAILNKQNLSDCDYVLLSVYPKATIDYLEENASFIKDGAVVIDCGGVKRSICEQCFNIASKRNFAFIGGHPMAGLHQSGFKYSKADLFLGASMILTPQNTDDISLLQKVTEFIKSIGFASVTATTPENHDRIIAFTSQLAHVVSNAYVKSPQAQVHKGFSAGSYKDLTRVAKLNENMWTELFLLNKDNLLFEIDCIINSLSEYKEALQNDDAETLKALLKDGSDRKKAIDN
ncbi:MAG: prephenate dehydrogenase/arogenate dehydrogenase family protein [Ruminococcus sp.]|nr:prephenate dehydrogenase/arogenate dehydrogenase family protein [Ruminococcus sp.]